jgi:hypothetical protein
MLHGRCGKSGRATTASGESGDKDATQATDLANGPLREFPSGEAYYKGIRTDERSLYVDKTAAIATLVRGGDSYFLARPRMFGKSLLLSTLKSLFLGEKELFEGLAISSTHVDWREHPVMHIDFSVLPINSPDTFRQGLMQELLRIGRSYELDLSETEPWALATLTDQLIRGLSAWGQQRGSPPSAS